jgi:hypothetical protein
VVFIIVRYLVSQKYVWLIRGPLKRGFIIAAVDSFNFIYRFIIAYGGLCIALITRLYLLMMILILLI